MPFRCRYEKTAYGVCQVVHSLFVKLVILYSQLSLMARPEMHTSGFNCDGINQLHKEIISSTRSKVSLQTGPVRNYFKV